jgi:glycerophosphoryl diester phosphodiesterase
MAQQRHTQIAQRRAGRSVLVHRGAWQFAKENTLEAYRASFELGADGNEIDLRRTHDGVGVNFHDDLLDFHLAAHGDVSDYTWEELRRFPFRRPGRFGVWTRIPTLVETFDLHRRWAGFLHLDVKDPAVAAGAAELLTVLDLWDHVSGSNHPAITSDPRYQPLSVVSLIDEGDDADPGELAAAVASGADALFVDDPRPALRTLGRPLGAVSDEPVRLLAVARHTVRVPPEADLAQVILDAPDWDALYPPGSAARVDKTSRILSRALAGEAAIRGGFTSPALLAALRQRLSERSLHQEWRWQGLDGEAAELALLEAAVPGSVDDARTTLWRQDPILADLLDAILAEDPSTPWQNLPLAWLDWRIKGIAWVGLEGHPDAAAVAQLMRDYLALPRPDAYELGFLQYENAARLLLLASPTTATGLELLGHPEQPVRSQAILELLDRAAEPWAYDALEQGAPFALDWIAPTPPGPPVEEPPPPAQLVGSSPSPSSTTSSATSSAGALWVSQPTEIRSTPVAATAATVSGVMPPEASVSTRPPG